MRHISRMEAANADILLDTVMYRAAPSMAQAFKVRDQELFLFLFDAETGQIIAPSISFLEHMGMEFYDVAGHEFLELVHDDDVPATRKAFEAAQKKVHNLASNEGFVNRYKCRDGFKCIRWGGSIPILDLWFVVAYPASEREYEINKQLYPQYWT